MKCIWCVCVFVHYEFLAVILYLVIYVNKSTYYEASAASSIELADLIDYKQLQRWRKAF